MMFLHEAKPVNTRLKEIVLRQGWLDDAAFAVSAVVLGKSGYGADLAKILEARR